MSVPVERPPFLKRLLRIEPGISLAQWAYDKYAAATLSLGAGGLVSYLAAITDWMKPWGPLGLGMCFVAVAFITVCGYWIYAKAKFLAFQNRMAKQFTERNMVSAAQDEFKNSRINISDFFSPYYTVLQRKRFDKCQIWGPAQIYFPEGAVLQKCVLQQVQVVIVSAKIVSGVTVFVNPIFTECDMCNLTWMMNRETYDALVSSYPDMMGGIPVISGLPIQG